MMLHLMIVDDDSSVINILKDIATQHLDDVIISTAMTGIEAINKINLEQPDVVLLDYLLPDCDGLHVIRSIRQYSNPSIIMISEVSDKQMIAKAYHERISFFITKPINVVEVVSVVSQVIASHKAHKTLREFEMAIRGLNHKSPPVEGDLAQDEKALKRIYSRLGIMGVSGCDDLIKAVLWAKRQKGDYALSELYLALVNRETNVKGPVDEQQIQAIKKRISRVIAKAFRVLATMGIEDPYNPVYEEYASQLFDYSELRMEMKLLEGSLSSRPGKINIKQFIESSVVLVE